MNHPQTNPDRPAAADAIAWEPRRPIGVTRVIIHVTLALVTFVTLAFSGGWFWGGVAGEFPRLGDYFEAEPWLRSVSVGLPYAAWVTAILGAHEMGHFLACLFYRIPATLPFFLPGIPPLGSFGAVIRIRGRIPDRRALFDVAAAGPIAGFVVALPALVLGILAADPATPEVTESGLSMGTPVVWLLLAPLWPHAAPPQLNQLIGAGWVGMLVTSLNLFPVGQLDGGHAAYAVSRRLHRLTVGGSLLLLIGVMLYQGFVLRQVPAYLVWFAILLWMGARHPRLLDETRPLGIGRLALGVLLLVLFVLSFIPVPFIINA